MCNYNNVIHLKIDRYAHKHRIFSFSRNSDAKSESNAVLYFEIRKTRTIENEIFCRQCCAFILIENAYTTVVAWWNRPIDTRQNKLVLKTWCHAYTCLIFQPKICATHILHNRNHNNEMQENKKKQCEIVWKCDTKANCTITA